MGPALRVIASSWPVLEGSCSLCARRGLAPWERKPAGWQSSAVGSVGVYTVRSEPGPAQSHGLPGAELAGGAFHVELCLWPDSSFSCPRRLRPARPTFPDLPDLCGGGLTRGRVPWTRPLDIPATTNQSGTLQAP